MGGVDGNWGLWEDFGIENGNQSCCAGLWYFCFSFSLFFSPLNFHFSKLNSPQFIDLNRCFTSFLQMIVVGEFWFRPYILFRAAFHQKANTSLVEWLVEAWFFHFLFCCIQFGACLFWSRFPSFYYWLFFRLQFSRFLDLSKLEHVAFEQANTRKNSKKAMDHFSMQNV